MSTLVEWPSYLVVGGIEVSNAARTLSYLQRGLGGPQFSVLRDPEEVYDILYQRLQVPFYTSPVDDPAPWWDSEDPTSQEFFGIILQRPLGFDSVTTREFDQLGGRIGGAAFARAINTPRTFQFQGTICASSAAGREFGRRWLANVLSSACDACVLADMSLYSHSPESDPSEGFWTFHRIAETSGVQEVQAYAEPNILDVQFTLVAGNPLMYSTEEIQVTPTVLNPEGTTGGPCVAFDEWLCGAPGPMHSASLNAPTVGTNGARITVTAAGGVNGVEINAYSSPPDDNTTPESSILLAGLPVGSNIVFDSAREEIWYTTPDGFIVDGSPMVVLDEGRSLDWDQFQAHDCDPDKWIGVRTDHLSAYGAEAVVAISTVKRAR